MSGAREGKQTKSGAEVQVGGNVDRLYALQIGLLRLGASASWVVFDMRGGIQMRVVVQRGFCLLVLRVRFVERCWLVAQVAALYKKFWQRIVYGACKIWGVQGDAERGLYKEAAEREARL